MASGRPPGGHPSAGRNDDLLQLEESTSPYNSGQRPPVNDEHLLQQYNIDDSDQPQPRPSVSYDAFVGGRQPPPMEPGPPHATFTQQSDLQHPGAPPHHPYAETSANRVYSQSSGLNNYQRYSDADDFDDDRSMQGYYNSQGADDQLADDNMGGRLKDRNSILSLGGGIMERAKNMLGMAPEYSEMDLPLTEAGARGSG